MLWLIFHVVLALLIYLDLKHEAHSWKTFAFWSLVWVGVAFLWNGVIYWAKGETAALQFFTAFLLEKSLSIDNLCVFLLIFSSFQIPTEYQKRVLLWGIVGAVVLRLVLILAGVRLVQGFHQIIYVFGAVLIYGGVRFIFGSKEVKPLHHHWLVAWLKRHFQIASHFGGGHLRAEGKWTMLAVVLILLEGSDLVFAFDSVPAVLAITRDPLVAYTSNVCAILGLRSLYFTLAPYLQNLHRARWSLGLILFFVGGKMVLESVLEIPTWITLAAIVTILCVAGVLHHLHRQSTGRGGPPSR